MTIKNTNRYFIPTSLPDPVMEPLLTSKQVAELLQVSTHTLCVKRKEWADVLPFIKFNGSRMIRYRHADVMNFLKVQQGEKTCQ